MTPNAIPQAQQPLVFLILLVLQTVILLIAVLVVMDARDRGCKKDAAVFWFFVIVFFFPIVFLYLFIRGRQNSFAPAAPLSAPKKTNCPYCNGPVAEDTKICPACGRLL